VGDAALAVDHQLQPAALAGFPLQRNRAVGLHLHGRRPMGLMRQQRHPRQQAFGVVPRGGARRRPAARDDQGLGFQECRGEQGVHRPILAPGTIAQ